MKKTIRTALLCGLLLLATTLAACGASTSFSHCDETTCTVSLTGADAETDLRDGDDTEVRLVTSDVKSATFEVEGAEATCAEGETVQVEAYLVTCTEVEKDALEIEIVNVG